MKKRLLNFPTLKDVASKAKVSIPIVSRVLNDSLDVRVHPETRERILRVAKELNYRPNAVAKSLKTRKTRMLVLFIPEVGNPVFPEIVRGVEEGAAEYNYTVFISHLGKKAIEKKMYLTILQERKADGLLLATAQLQDSIVNDLATTNLPFVLINRRALTTNNFVIVDDALGSKIAVEYLIEMGHRHIAHLAGPLIYDTLLRRFQGYRESLAKHGLPFDSSLVEECSFESYDGGKNGMARLLSKGKKITAVFAVNLMVAIGAMACIKESGLRIPQDISIVALHDAPLAEVLDPPLTVVRMPLEEMGRKAVTSLINLLEKNIPIVSQVLPPIGITIRKSVDKPRNNLE